VNAEKGYRADQIRFFLIYEHYRKKLNFTFKRLAEASRRLDEFKSMVGNLRNAKSHFHSEEAEELANSLVSAFSENMNSDLNVKDAFNQLFLKMSKLDGLNKKERLNAENAKAALEGLQCVDRVLRVIF